MRGYLLDREAREKLETELYGVGNQRRNFNDIVPVTPPYLDGNT